MSQFHIDHTDPIWKEGRDYQLVCGLDVVYNYEERDPSTNIRKGNRFLPWRNSQEELGGDPRNLGDLCLFLDPDTGEWVLEEFMGEWWFDKSLRTSSRFHQRGRVMSERVRLNLIQELRGRTQSKETKRKISEGNKGKPKSEQHKQSLKEGHKRRYGKKMSRMMSRNDPMMGDFED